MILKPFDNVDGCTKFVDATGTVVLSLDDGLWGPYGEIEIEVISPPAAKSIASQLVNQGGKHWAHMNDAEMKAHADKIVKGLMNP